MLGISWLVSAMEETAKEEEAEADLVAQNQVHTLHLRLLLYDFQCRLLCKNQRSVQWVLIWASISGHSKHSPL